MTDISKPQPADKNAQPESALTFPCEFPIKIMGRDTPEFHQTVAAAFSRHAAPLDSLQVSRQPSREGRFISLTVTIMADSRAQLDALYSELSGNSHVLVTL
ncbi:MAG: YbeD family protein [Gammaproteobacteria bacterium]